MLTKENFSEQHIADLRRTSNRDPALLERTVYAFGLLEAISRVGLPFIFKGGTCLMLLLDHPMRLSTDIDIIVEPGTDIQMFLNEAAKIFPFEECNEQVRVGKNSIEKRHFKFTYLSPVSGRSIYILLDILFEKNHYSKLVEKEIRNDLLLTEGECLKVKIPSVSSILGDKLTAFAPHTIGIPLNANKDMEVIKQMYDVSTLIDAYDDFEELYKTYFEVAASEIAYRGIGASECDCLTDTILSAANIASRGKINSSDYAYYVKGCKEVQGHIYAEKFSAETAAVKAPKIMYMAACLLKQKEFSKVRDPGTYFNENFIDERFKVLKYLKKLNMESFAYAIMTDRLLAEE